MTHLPAGSVGLSSETFLTLVRLISVWMEGRLQLKPESEPRLSKGTAEIGLYCIKKKFLI